MASYYIFICNTIYLRKMCSRTHLMIWWFRELTSPAEDLGSIPTTYMTVHNRP